jgi:hypothetical protein
MKWQSGNAEINLDTYSQADATFEQVAESRRDREDTKHCYQKVGVRAAEVLESSWDSTNQDSDGKELIHNYLAAQFQQLIPSADTNAIIEQVKASYPDIKKGTFKFVFPDNSVSIVNKRKRSLTRLIKSAKNTIKKEGKNVEDIKFSVYEISHYCYFDAP